MPAGARLGSIKDARSLPATQQNANLLGVPFDSHMPQASHSWQEFKALIDAAPAGPMFYRGQSRAAWGLVSTFHRLVSPPNPSTYWLLLELVHDYVSTWADRTWDLNDNLSKAAFLGYLQHNGFPTPLLDWTYSPYVAAYFAFEGVNDAVPDDDNVAIHRFDHLGWSRDWKQVYDINDQSAHVSVLQSQSRGNRKQLLHQGAYTYSTVPDQEVLIRALESQRPAQGLLGIKTQYLEKFTISVHEKPRAMRDFGAMGLTPMTLFPGIEGVCRHLKFALFPAPSIGLTPEQRTAAFIEALTKAQDEFSRTKDIGAAPVSDAGAPPAQSGS